MAIAKFEIFDDFASQVFQLPLADYRLENLPPGDAETEAQHSRKNLLTPGQKQERFDLLDEGECGVSELAVRFNVGRTTIRRIVSQQEAETGIRVKRKPSLNQAQIEEIVRLRQEGVSAVDIAKRFSGLWRQSA